MCGALSNRQLLSRGDHESTRVSARHLWRRTWLVDGQLYWDVSSWHLLCSRIPLALSCRHLWQRHGLDLGTMLGHLSSRWVLSAQLGIGSGFGVWFSGRLLPTGQLAAVGRPCRILFHGRIVCPSDKRC